jgi:hypothetical protein
MLRIGSTSPTGEHMEEIIAGGILLAVGKLALTLLVLRLVWATLAYVFDHPWIVWILVGLGATLIYVTYENLWRHVEDHAAGAVGFMMVLPAFASILFCLWKGAAGLWRFAQRGPGR